MAKPKVLIVEDNFDIQRNYREALESVAEVLSAYTIKEAEELFATNPDIVAITMDACVPGGKPNTQHLVRMMRATFSGPMIAASSDSYYCGLLKDAGCSHSCDQKWMLPKELKMVLGL